MFAIGMAILWVIVMVYYGASERHRENKNRNQAISKGRDWYLDRNGLQHKTDTREPFVVRTDFKTGHKIQVNPYTGKIMTDLSKEYEAKCDFKGRIKATDNGYSVYSFETPYKVNERTTKYKHKPTEPVGERFRRLDGGDEVFVARRMADYITKEGKRKPIPFFMNIKDGRFSFFNNELLNCGNQIVYTKIEDNRGVKYKMNLDKESLSNYIDYLNMKQSNGMGVNWYNNYNLYIEELHNGY